MLSLWSPSLPSLALLMSRAEEESSSPRPFRLSALLGGHTDDVRALAAGPSSRLISGSRDGTARTWARTGVKEGRTGGWEEESVLRDHEGFVNSVAWLPPREDDAGVPKGECFLRARAGKGRSLL